MFKTIQRQPLLAFLFTFFLMGCSTAPQRGPSGEKIENGVNTIVIASNKSAKEFVRELKYRALEKDFTFDKADADTFSFVTEMKNLSKKLGVRMKAYVKSVGSGSNAVVSGVYLKRKSKKHDPEKISNRSGSNRKPAWDALFDYATFDKGAKYNFIER